MKNPKDIIMDMISKDSINNNPYICPRCGADFPNDKLLRIHIIGHKEY